MNFRNFIKDNTLILDGAMGTMIQDLFLSDSAFGGAEFKMLSDLLVFSRPHDVKNIHLQYYQAGAHAVETNSFGASRLRLKEYDFTRLDLADFPDIPGVPDPRQLSYNDMSFHLSRRAAEIAVMAREEYKSSPGYDGRPLYVFGSIGPSNSVLSATKANLQLATYDEIVDNFYVQVRGLIAGGVDVLLFETQQDQLELKAAIHGAQKALKEMSRDLPIVAQVTVDPYGKMQIFNTDILAALTTLEGIGIDVFGLNCSIGPDLMIETVKRLSQVATLPLSVIPNAGLPVSEAGKTVFKLSPEDFAGTVKTFVSEYGVRIVGGCCGTRPAHIRAVSDILRGVKTATVPVKKSLRLSGPQNAVELDSRDALIRIGERLNVRGSLKVRDAVEKASPIDMAALEEVVREQVVDLGLSVIDVCMDSNVVNTENVLVDVIREITCDFSGALCIDSFSVEALLKAIEVYSGRPIINSISLEEYAPGLDKVDAVVAPTCKHNPVYIALTTGPKGPAVTREEKLGLAREIYDKCTSKYAIKPEQLIFDINAFPIGSESVEGMNFAMETLAGIPLVKAIHPDVRVSLGVGNLTNGLASKPYMRQLLTSVFVDEARKVGLDAAIINPNHYVPVSSLDKSDYELALRVIRERDMDAYGRLEEIALVKKGGAVVKKTAYGDMTDEDAVCARIRDGFKEKNLGELQYHGNTYSYADAIVPVVARALTRHKPLDFINGYLMAAMKDLGDGFGRGEVSLPHLLKAADVMKHAMAFIEAVLRHTTGKGAEESMSFKGTVVLGTVYQDVHSIGKDLVKTLLENYGYRVIDLGVQTPLEKFIETAKKEKAQAIGMSALLVQTSNHMITVSQMLEKEGLAGVDILIGGAPVNHRHAAYVSMHGQDDVRKLRPNVFYCPSGMDGVNTMNQLAESKEKRAHLVEENRASLIWHYEQALRAQASLDELLRTLPRRKVTAAPVKASPGQWGVKKITYTMAELKQYLDVKTLFSLNWNYGGAKSWEKKGVTQQQLCDQLDEWVELCDKNGWIKPQALVALFPCFAEGDTVVVLDVACKNEIARIPFSVVVGGDKADIFSLAQYYQAKADDGVYDTIGFQLTTSGLQVDERIEELKKNHDTAGALLLQGLSDRVAEDLAERAHKELRQRAGVPEKQGIRSSPGYPGLKDITVNRTIAEILGSAGKLAVTLTDAAEFVPTGTTAAVVCFHSSARYD